LYFCGVKKIDMTTSIDIETNLIDEAMIISGLPTPIETINIALQEFVRRNNRRKILNYRGKHIWEGDLNEMRMLR
jgi:Arc/MetJ family transcription regulator